MRSLGLLMLGFVATLASAGVAERAAAFSAPRVVVFPTPGDGIQPQAVADGKGTIHLVYFIGDPAAGNLYYVPLTARAGSLIAAAPPVRVNSIAGSALATGTVRGAQIALGRDGTVHVAWHGSQKVEAEGIVPVWYARSKDGRTFEPQRVVSGNIAGIDGSTVAADATGRVAVAWHGLGPKPGEGERLVYLASSTDDGAAFGRPAPATSAPTGACGCCGLKALFDRSGTLNLLYRAATDGKHRDATWVAIVNGTPRLPVRVHPWDLEACPMTTFALADAGPQVEAAWETAEQIYSATLDPVTGTVSRLAAVPGTGSRKHPSIAVNSAGARLLAWTEGTAWKRGGTFAWRVTDRGGNELASAPDAGRVPVWGLVSAAALPDGSFVIVH